MSERARKVLENSDKQGVPQVIRAQDITDGNTKLNTMFVAEIFNHKHGLEQLNEEEKEQIEAFEKACMIEDFEGARDERSYRFWINSLELDHPPVRDLYEDCKDAHLLLKVIHKLDPAVI